MATKANKALIAAREFFQRNVTEEIERLGATRTGRDQSHTLATPAGRMKITVYENWIATCFEDSHLAHVATKQIGCREDQVVNYISGKWNFHYVDHVDSLSHPFLPADFVSYLELLLAYRPTQADQQEAGRLRALQSARRAAMFSNGPLLK